MEDIPGMISAPGFAGPATADSVTVTWMAPLEPNGVVVQYTLVYSERFFCLLLINLQTPIISGIGIANFAPMFSTKT